MLGKNRVPQSVAHAQNHEGNAAEQKQLSRAAHWRDAPDLAFARASRLPVYRRMPIHMASMAMITKSPPISAKPPATSPKHSSSNTQTGNINEPRRSRMTQRRFHLSFKLTYG